ncbi:MAG: L-2-hydroxyglutarate oxidase [Xanthomonadales bacterium]|nr:L-2-hydroxyglutarate oxidase [Xanthomonadales bacterium]
MRYDVIIIGGGIVGLASAIAIQQRWPRRKCLLLEKEPGPARHQSGHNSGVVHAGVYYQPGSLKARLCREGAAATRAFCQEHGVRYRTTGKLLVATTPLEEHRLCDLFDRCRRNGLEPEWLSGGALREREPAVTGVSAALVRESGITDYPEICRLMLQQFLGRGGEACFGTKVTDISEHGANIIAHCADRSFTGRQLIVCAGLMADRLVTLHGLQPRFRIIPYRGEYYRLAGPLSTLVHHLIYPVPDPALPFLGVHLTPTIDGEILVGPNAVQGWKREGYGTFNFSPRDTWELLAFKGFWKVSARHLCQGLREIRNSVWKQGYLAEVRKYCPAIQLEDLQTHPAGIRAQAVRADGRLIDDFLIEETPRSLHVCNAPSPAATAAIPIGRFISERLALKPL